MATQTPTTATAPLGSTARTNQLLSESSKQTGVAAPTFNTSSPSQVSNAISTSLNTTSKSGGSTNPKDAPGYVPGSLPGDNLAPGSTPDVNPTTNSSVNTSQPGGTASTATGGGTNAPSVPSGIPGQPNLVGNQSQQAGQAIDQLKAKYGQALSDITGTKVPPPSDQGAASAGLNTALGTQPPPATPQPTTTPNVDAHFDPSVNPASQEGIQQLQEYISPQATRDDLTKQMSVILGEQSDLSAEKLQLMNVKNVMSGTADDLRNEVTAANGFATESQIQALATSRNATLLKQATLIQDQITSQQEQIANNTQLLGFEKDMANTQATQRMGILQYATTNYNNSINGQRTSLEMMQKSEGWDGIYKAALASGDPQAIQRIAQAMGPGFDLASMAKQDAQARIATNAKTAADLANTQANTANTQANTAKTRQEVGDASGLPNPAKANQPGYTATGVKYNKTNAQQEILNEFKNQGVMGSRNLLPPANYNQGKAWWVQQGLSASDYDNIFGQYKDQSIPKQYN